MIIINSLTKEIIMKLVLIIISSLLIGINRGRKNQFAGMKTHLFVGLGSGLSFIGPYIYYINNPTVIGDPYRLAAQVISGIGFLGAGTIIKSGQSIRGLTTAASLWCTAIIAITYASGGYIVGTFCTIIIIIFLSFSNKIDFTRKYSTKCIVCTIVDINKNFDKLNDYMDTHAVLNGNYTILEHKNLTNHTTTIIRYDIVHRQTNLATNEIMQMLGNFSFVQSVESITEIEKSQL